MQTRKPDLLQPVPLLLPRIGTLHSGRSARRRSALNLFAYPSNRLTQVDVRGQCPKEEDGDPVQEAKSATKKPTPPAGEETPTEEPGEPSAFPNLQRGGDNTNEHAQKVVDVINSDRPSVGKDRSVTVIEHDNGTVSVGLSGGDPKRATQAQQVVDRLNELNPPDEGRPPTYKTTDGPVDTTGLVDPGKPNPRPGNCSEAQAAQAAGQNGSPPKSYQTVSSGSDPGPYAMPGQTTNVGPNPAPLMQPCTTCQTNAGNYDRNANKGSVPSSSGG